jgi:GTPase SAR1 family protein
LFLDDTQLAGRCWQENLSFPQLIELSIRGCANWPSLTLKKLLRRSPKLRYLDASDCPQIEGLEVLPDSLRVLKLNSCSNLQLLPESFPAPLRRLELRGAEKLTDLPLISSRLDYLDLRQTSALKQLPTFECLTNPLQENEPHPLEYWVSPERVWSDREWIVQPSTPRPRTLYLFGSGIEIPVDLKGADADSNVSEEVFTRLKESDFEAFRELKVILLGNGRSGKSSFAKVWKLGEFDANQSSTHGIQLWTLDLELSRIDDDPSEDGDKPFARINVWDFAGQDLYHGTHRLFMQSDAIFVILDGPADLPGSDDASDEIERQREQEEQRIGVGDRPRSPEYWYKMITSLGSNPHTHEAPPVLLIRSKTDRRPPSGNSSLPAYVKEVQFSSKIVAEALTKLQKPDPKELSFDDKIPQGLTTSEKDHFLQFQEAIQWIRQQCRVLLGPFDRHKMPKSTIRVIRELRKLSDENDKVYRAANPDADTGMGTQHRCEVPHPFLSYDEFHHLVKKECKHYGMRPELLLKSLHSRGLVYYDKRLLPDSVILDQRWAIRGIYTLFDRFDGKSLIEQLHRSHGVVSKQRLQECWERRNFNAVDQELFLNFMKSCGMIFQLLSPEEALSGSPVFSIPSFMPKQPDPELRNSLDNLQSVSVTIPNVNEAEIRSLISKLGGEWSRSMAAYRWGCIKKSENCDDSWFWMHWLDEPNKMEYGFNLRLLFPGQRDQELEAVVRKTVGEVFRASRGWGDADLEKVWPTSSSASESSVSLEVLKSPGISDETIRSQKRVGRRIGISYAGCDKDASGNPKQNENFWIGEIPNRLGKLLENQRNQLGLLAVDYYGSPDAPNMIWRMIDNLAKSDIFIGFFSKKYFESPWCMVELYQLFDREPRGEFPKDQVLFIDLVQEAHEPGLSYRRDSWISNAWNDYWSQRRVDWEKRAVSKIATEGMSDLERQHHIDSWLNSNFLEVTRWVNVVREVDRSSLNKIFQAVKTYSDAIEVSLPSGNGSAGKSIETVLSAGVSRIFDVVVKRFFV